MKNRILSGAPSEEFAGYTKAVIDGPTIYVSGTMGHDPVTGATPEGVAEQARNTLASIDKALAAAGAGLENAIACHKPSSGAGLMRHNSS